MDAGRLYGGIAVFIVAASIEVATVNSDFLQVGGGEPTVMRIHGERRHLAIAP